MVHEIKVSFDVKREGRCDLAMVPCCLDVSDECCDGILG